MSSTLPDFPKALRGTYRVSGDDVNTESQKLEMANDILRRFAKEWGVHLLLDAKLQGSRWVLTWWPASEPRHQATDQIIYGYTLGDTDGQSEV